MPDNREGAPESLPAHWSTAHDLWRDVERFLPAETPTDMRAQLERDCCAVFERVFDMRGQETQISMSGEWGPEFVAEMVRRTVELAARQVSSKLILELVLLRVEVACLKTRVRNLEDGQR